MKVLDGKAVAQTVLAEVASGVRALRAATGTTPMLAVVLVGDFAPSKIYIANKKKAADGVGIASRDFVYPAGLTQAELTTLLTSLNADPAVHGILLQLPLPRGLDEDAAIETIAPAKDVDGFHPLNLGRLLAGAPTVVPCTPAGCLEILDHYGADLRGAEAVVIGRSRIVGKPLAQLLLARHATVTVCHTRTRDLAAHTRRADVLCVDSSDGFSEWQADTIAWIRGKYGDAVKVGGGNVVDAEGFRFLADAGADFVKIGIGGGSICITREQKGIGRGQATAVIEVAHARDEYFRTTGVYVPLCSDGGIVYDYHIVLALAMGADFVMMGRFFARFDEAPGRRLRIGGNYVKEYWGEGSNRARNWQRYHEGDTPGLGFEEGVDGYVPYAGKLKDNIDLTLDKVRSAMVSCGASTIPELQTRARITLASAVSIREGSAHDIELKDNEILPTV